MDINEVARALYPQIVTNNWNTFQELNCLKNELIDRCGVSSRTAEQAAAQAHAEHQQVYIEGYASIDLDNSTPEMLALKVNGNTVYVAAAFLALATQQTQPRSRAFLDS